MGHDRSIFEESWPAWEKRWLVQDTVEIVVQINGKVRSRMEVPAAADREELEKLALDDPRVKELIADKEVRKVICVPKRLVNIVVH
jgi:leucyl-tRNA synthetase